MRSLFIVLIVLGTLWVLLMALLVLVALASSHNVPTSTFVAITGFAGIGFLVILVSVIGLKKVKK